MNTLASKRKMAKRKASIAVREIIRAARKYIEAEDALEQAIRKEQKQIDGNDMKGVTECLP